MGLHRACMLDLERRKHLWLRVFSVSSPHWHCLQNVQELWNLYDLLFLFLGGKICIASNLFLNGLIQTLLSFIKIVLAMYYKSVLNSGPFFGDILRPFFNNALCKSSSFNM